MSAFVPLPKDNDGDFVSAKQGRCGSVRSAETFANLLIVLDIFIFFLIFTIAIAVIVITRAATRDTIHVTETFVVIFTISLAQQPLIY